ncbi:MAG: hypothetical protein JXB39_10775 [Deltaproteobacteria bacterium]|nr:hypothetical protein [Deltaproteobacteria bacterium]
MTAARNRGKSVLSLYLAERAAQRNAGRDRPDASAVPVEKRPVPQVEVTPEPKPEPRRRRIVRPIPEVPEPVPAKSTPPAAKATRKARRPVRASKLDAYVDKIGMVPDAEVAALAGVTRDAVRKWRERHGVPLPTVAPEPSRTAKHPAEPVKAKERTSTLDAFADKIGVLQDAEVAAMAGVARSTVVFYRKTRGIPPAKRTRARVLAKPAVEVPMVETPVPVEPPEVPEPIEPQVEPRKQEPAPIVFTEAPVPVKKPAPAEPVPEAVPAPESASAPPSPKRKRGRPSKIDQFADKLGVMADADLAALAGLAVTTVQKWRKVKGIAEPLATPPEAAPVVEEAVEPAVVEQVPVGVAEALEPTSQPSMDGTAARTVRLTDRVEAMLEALAKARGIDPDAAIAVAIAQDYMRCRPVVGEE